LQEQPQHTQRGAAQTASTVWATARRVGCSRQVNGAGCGPVWQLGVVNLALTVTKRICPARVDLPASICPMNTMFKWSLCTQQVAAAAVAAAAVATATCAFLVAAMVLSCRTLAQGGRALRYETMAPTTLVARGGIDPTFARPGTLSCLSCATQACKESWFCWHMQPACGLDIITPPPYMAHSQATLPPFNNAHQRCKHSQGMLPGGENHPLT
jgi:hypothetical protein